MQGLFARERALHLLELVFPSAFLDLFLELGGVDRMMFSADHPYRSITQARVSGANTVSAADRGGAPAHGNAEKLLGLWVTVVMYMAVRRTACAEHRLCRVASTS